MSHDNFVSQLMVADDPAGPCFTTDTVLVSISVRPNGFGLKIL